MPFQTRVNIQPPPAQAGDFSSANPRSTVQAGAGALVAGPAGLTCGRFAWTDPDMTVANNFGSGPVAGFVHREFGDAMITTYLAESGNIIPAGFNVSVFDQGDFWALNNGANEVTVGMKAYASFVDGSVTFGPTGTPPVAGTATAAIAPETGSFTGSISGNVLAITAVGSGVAVTGGILSGTNVASGTMIIGQISGAVGGIGLYTINLQDQAVASTAIAETYGLMTVSAILTGTVNVGDPVTGSGVTAGSYIAAAGATAGTYVVTPTQTVASETITTTAGIETRWSAMSPGAAGALVKISSHPLG